jgi:hypothetical protein
MIKGAPLFVVRPCPPGLADACLAFGAGAAAALLLVWAIEEPLCGSLAADGEAEVLLTALDGEAVVALTSDGTAEDWTGASLALD